MGKKYFMFSSEQMKMKKEISQKIGTTYNPGVVFIGSSSKQFTDIIDDPALAKFPDSIIVTSGELSSINYRMGSD